MKIVINGDEIDIGGGTGGGTVQWEDINGRPDLSTVSSMVTAPIILNASLWAESNRQTIPVDGALADEEQQLVIVKPKRASRSLFNSCGIECVDQTDGALVFECKTVPESDISVNAFLFGVAEVGEEFSGEFVWWSPQMTSNTTPSPYVASANSSITNEGHIPYKAFDGTPTTDYWGTGGQWSSIDNSGPSYVQIDFGRKIVVSGVKINPGYATTLYQLATPPNLYIAGSDDGEKWKTIFSDSDVTWANVSEYSEFMFDKPVSYRYFRFGSISIPAGSSFNGRTAYGDIQFSVIDGSV